MLTIPVPITLFFIFDGDVTAGPHYVCEKYIVARDFIYYLSIFFTYFLYPFIILSKMGLAPFMKVFAYITLIYFTLKNSEILLFYVIIQLAVLGQVLFDKSTWYLIAFIKPKKVRRSLFSSGVILALLTLSFTAILMIALYSGSFGQFQVLIFTFLYEVQPGFFDICFPCYCTVGRCYNPPCRFASNQTIFL
ncbi:hypothetical protein OL548_30705 [Lysinibacillus sp. MHQ-1]|nr:hypothetical protein OL548_30705 [Lysinibacillus sp. MHQ-1]